MYKEAKFKDSCMARTILKAWIRVKVLREEQICKQTKVGEHGKIKQLLQRSQYD